MANIVNDIITNKRADINIRSGYYRTTFYTAITKGYLEMLGILLEPNNKVEITEEMVKAAAGNEESGETIVQLLLEKYGDDVKITEEVVKAATEN